MHEPAYRDKQESDNESENNDSGFSNLSGSTTIEQSINTPNNPTIDSTDQITTTVVAGFASLRIGNSSPEIAKNSKEIINHISKSESNNTITSENSPNNSNGNLSVTRNMEGDQNIPIVVNLQNEQNPAVMPQNVAINANIIPQGNGQIRNQHNAFINNRNHIGPIHQAISNLPHFDGNPRMLRQFTTSLRHRLSSYGPENERCILTYIPSRLRGKAYQVFGGTTLLYNTIQEFLEAVKTEFGGIHDMDTIKMELYQVQQDDGEPISEYAGRVKDIEQRLLAAYEATINADDENRNYNNDPVYQRLNRDIVENFLHGLKSPPEHQVAVKNPINLTEAARYAETLEKKQQFALGHRNVVKNNITHLQKPRKPQKSNSVEPDYSESDSEINQLIELIKDLKTSANVRRITLPETITVLKCAFCKNEGHKTNDCQLLINAIRDDKLNPFNFLQGYIPLENYINPSSLNQPAERANMQPQFNESVWSNINTTNPGRNFENMAFNNQNTFNNNDTFFPQNRIRFNSPRRPYINEPRNTNFYNSNYRQFNQRSYRNNNSNNFGAQNYPGRRFINNTQEFSNYNNNFFRNRSNIAFRNGQNYPYPFRGQNFQQRRNSYPRYLQQNEMQQKFTPNNSIQDSQNYLNSTRPMPQESPGNSQQQTERMRN